MKQFVLFLLVVLFVVFAIGSFANADTLESRAIVKVMEANAAAANNEDMLAYKKTAVVNFQQEMAIRHLWNTYDLEVTPGSITVLDVDGDFAIARGQIITIKKAGPAFKDNVMTALFYLRKVDGVWWKITGTTVEDVKYIDPSKAKNGIIDAEFIRKAPSK